MKKMIAQKMKQLPGRLIRQFHFSFSLAIFSTFLLIVSTQLLYAQNNESRKIVKGVVVNEKNEPVVGASVTVQGLKVGTTTNERGAFSLSVPEKSTLVISYVGYQNKFIDINKNTSDISIQLQSANNDLDQVVVVGYGTQRKRDVTGSVSSVNEQTLRDVPVANMQQALQGKAAGLEIQTVGTKPGSGAQIRIRGTRSISGSNDPLLVLDGIPYDGSLNDINPDDVASVEILKDASATAIYGSRGANGVLLVTTKRGKAGATRVSYSGYYGIGTVSNKYPVFNAAEYQAMRNISPWNQGYEPEELAYMASGKSTDWQNLMYQNSHKTDQNITVSGGTANGSTFSLGGGYYNETALLPGQDFTRYSVRATIDSKVGNKIKIGLNTMNSVGVTNGSQFVNPMFPILALSPLMPAYDSTGKIITAPNGNNDDRQIQYSPLLLNHNNNSWVDRVRRLRTFNSLYAEYQIMPGLKYRANIGLNYTQEEDDQFQASDDPTGINPSYFRPQKGNTAYVNNAEAWGYTVENILTYDKSIKKHRLNFTGLYSIKEYHTHNTSVSKDSITDNFSQFYALGLSNPTPAPAVGGGEQSWALISYMGRLNYNYDNRYMLTLTGRIDGSSRLANGHKWHQYPAVSAGWNLNNEQFFRNSKFLSNNFSNLKLRAGFGQTSNQSINPYSSLGLVSNNNGLASPGNVIRYNYGPTVVTGYNVSALPNPNLDWEYTKTVNVGIDFGILKNRITGSIEYYHQHTDKILYSVVLPPTSGVSGNYTTNVGSMQNQGMEFTVSTINIQNRHGFSWTTDLNLFFNQNKLLSLSSGIAQDIANQLFVGYSMTAIYDYKKLGIWQKNEAAQAAQYGSVPGQIKLEDHSGPGGKPDGKIDANNDRYVIGNGDAKLQGGMTNRFAYKNFDLSIVAYARFGGLLVSQIHQPVASYLTVMDGKRNGIKVDYWTPTSPTNWFPEPSTSISPISTAWTTLGYYNASFVQIRSINLGYSFRDRMLKRVNAQSIRLYFTVDNVGFLFSPYKNQTGIDPIGTNVGNAGVGNPGNLRSGNNGMVTINASTPLPRNFIVGANISF
ncbi:TonB-dependent receptor [Hydrotalea sp.]|uniref:SusC/RagA family TonB-linked outer membrane protein n=1 Tax=Hydrotalea sp. TaxID=2881279 RepID=UPI0025875E46|nr:TonB-dependent receptor [Hydrotalea sp.]